MGTLLFFRVFGVVVLLGLLLTLGIGAGVSGFRTDAPVTLLGGPLLPPDLAALDGLGEVAPALVQDCPEPGAPLDRVLYDHLRGQGAALSCGNAFGKLVHFPNDDSGLSGQAPNPMGGFAEMARQISAARHEVLLANMLWDDGADSPGALLAQAIAGLRRQVAQHPERFPDGVTVRLMFGNSIRLDSLLDSTSSVYSAAQHLLEAGVPLAHDQLPGFTLQLANYTYAYPHNHLKLLVIDGQTATAGGANISLFHVPSSNPGGLDLTDLLLTLRGPVARHTVAAFRDSWLLSRPLRCGVGVTVANVRQNCALVDDETPYPLFYTAPPQPAGTSRAYGLYRRAGYETQDSALPALFAAAGSSIDLMQSQISGTVQCSLSLTAPGGCPFPAQDLPVWQAIVGAIRDHGVRVRLVLDHDPLLQVEPLSLLAGIQAYLKPLGLEDRLQVRWSGTAGGMHTKAALVDDAMLTVGSLNLHFSSFGERGLSEYTLATSDPAALKAIRQTFDFEWARGKTMDFPAWLGP
ncbi:phospholipase D-like domain-containing protein [Deinococcus arenicola]|uniref:Phospholipase D-like domain-containing protein n=1 Tax=Deinococcus arenicola TaxID=2994950 RepID=A0ABU4DM92_9DEIO|nr:phospholipase D-like domain-containing protein [Deinococcus sp. ZS9-10]MDV6373468.1 phospholipase D-like domain-containing protein [Deinococcus sp. ZS9-10]